MRILVFALLLLCGGCSTLPSPSPTCQVLAGRPGFIPAPATARQLSQMFGISIEEARASLSGMLPETYVLIQGQTVQVSFLNYPLNRRTNHLTGKDLTVLTQYCGGH